MKMRNLRLKTSGSVIKAVKQVILAISVICICMPWLILLWRDYNVTPELRQILTRVLFVGFYLLFGFLMIVILLSRYSPIKLLAVRKNLILFTRLFIKSGDDGTMIHSVGWKYQINDKIIVIDLYPNGLVDDTAKIGKKLSECLGESLLDYEEAENKTRYIFGTIPERYSGIELLGEGISSLDGDYKPRMSYDPVPIYDKVSWNINSEALHMLLIAPSGAGKTMLLNYLAGMILKRQHMLYIVDAKNSSFGALFRHVGVPVATNVEEIIQMLTALVNEMEEIYAKYFASGEAAIDANYSTLKIKGHFLIFDEILSVLDSAGKKEKAEIERLLGQLALKGRAAGFALIVSAQKLNATDLPKAITEQCQTRIVLGKMVSDETFHQVMGAYKKDLAHAYRGGVGMGYAVTPKTGLSYIETPLMPHNSRDYILLLKELRDRGTPYGEGR